MRLVSDWLLGSDDYWVASDTYPKKDNTKNTHLFCEFSNEPPTSVTEPVTNKSKLKSNERYFKMQKFYATHTYIWLLKTKEEILLKYYVLQYKSTSFKI